MDSYSSIKKEDRGDNTIGGNNLLDSSTHLSCNPYLSPSSENQSEGIDLTSFYPSMYPPNSKSLSITPSGCSFDEDATNSISTENRLHQARFVLENQQLYNRYTMCLAHLQESLKEIDTLREENDNLRVNNADLVERLSLLSQATIQNCLLSSDHPPLSFMNDLNRLSLGGTVGDSAVAEEVHNISPTSVIEHNRFHPRNTERVALPKSIAVRSNGYLNVTQRGGSNGGPRRGNRAKSPVLNESQRVYVPAGRREEEALELEVYSQGMLKTELCNKWQETGKCPYGENCQFAHGIRELRPVIRHPRYKTEVCRMVLAGDTCPYGHRCHFRHSLTDQERLLGPLGLNDLTDSDIQP